jgi:hypothetical protein
MPSQPRTKRLTLAEREELRTFINAVRAVNGQDPIPFSEESRKKFDPMAAKERYEGLPIYSWVSGSGRRFSSERM